MAAPRFPSDCALAKYTRKTRISAPTKLNPEPIGEHLTARDFSGKRRGDHEGVSGEQFRAANYDKRQTETEHDATRKARGGKAHRRIRHEQREVQAAQTDEEPGGDRQRYQLTQGHLRLADSYRFSLGFNLCWRNLIGSGIGRISSCHGKLSYG